MTFTGRTPDLTPAQLVSSVLAIIGLLVSQGIIDNQREKLIGGIASIAIPVVWQLADAIIRHGRAKALAPTAPPPGGGA